MADIDIVKKACAILSTINQQACSPARYIAGQVFTAIRPGLTDMEAAAFALLIPATEPLGNDAQAIYDFPMVAQFDSLLDVPEIGNERRLGIQTVLVDVCKAIIIELVNDLRAVLAEVE